MSVARQRGVTALPPRRAFDLWTDTARWPTWVDGFGALERRHERWPEPGATLVWRSRPGGRGTVTEKVALIEPPGRFAVDVVDDKMSGRQTVTFEQDEGGCVVQVELDYRLNASSPLMAVADKIFIRRSMADSLRRTLTRFAIEAADDAAFANPAG